MSTRAERVDAEVAERGLDAMLVTDLVNLRWLTGFTGSNGAAITCSKASPTSRSARST